MQDDCKADLDNMILASVRRRLDEASQLLNHTSIPMENRAFVHDLINCAGLAVAELVRA